MASDSPSLALLEGYEDALDMLDDSLVSIVQLLEAQRSGQPLSESALVKLERQRTAAAVGATKLRNKLQQFRARSAEQT